MMLQYVFSGKFQMNMIIVSMSKSGSLKRYLKPERRNFCSLGLNCVHLFFHPVLDLIASRVFVL